MGRRNPESNLGKEAVEPSSKRRKSDHHLFRLHEVEHKILLGNNITEGRQEEEEQEEGPDWSEIPQDILEEITARIHIGDRIQSSRVCKHWRSTVVQASPRSRPASYGSPCWLRLFDGPRKRCTLMDPLRNERYIIDTPTIPKDVFIEYSDNGWLLLTKYKRPGIAVFFFNPLTKAIVKLPKLQTEKVHTFSFTSEPTSSECRIIGKPSSYGMYSTSLCYWASGEKEWKIFPINHQETIFNPSNHKPFFLEDRIYHMDFDGRLGFYKLAEQKLTVVAGERPVKIRNSYDYYDFLKVDDKLVFVYMEAKTKDCRRIHLYEFDERKEQWFQLESTRGRNLFSYVGNCIVSKATPSAEGERVYAWDYVKMEVMMSYGLNELQIVKFEDDDSGDVYDSSLINVCWIDLKS